MVNMKSESCKKCGCKLEINTKCDICNQVNQFFCHGCGYVTEEQIHFQCRMISLDHTLLRVR